MSESDSDRELGTDAFEFEGGKRKEGAFSRQEKV